LDSLERRDDHSPVRELSSWKEIAAYLGVSIRTAQSFEKERQLPVHRLAGPRGRVTTTSAELEDWKRRADSERLSPTRSSANPVSSPTPGSPQRPALHRLTWLLPVMAIVGLAILLSGGISVRGVPQPFSARVEHSTLIAADARGHELWRKEFPFALHPTEYRDRPSTYLWVGDLDADGTSEVLFVPVPAEQQLQSTPLLCYSSRGEERWRFTPQLSVHTSTEPFSPIYFIAGLAVTAPHILVVSNHYLYYPTQVALLSPTGGVVRQYWHSGHLHFPRFADLDHDGKPEAYLAGISNAWRAITLIILDPFHFDGASQEPEHPQYQLAGFPNACERARVILPRSCMNLKLDPYNTVTDLWVRDGEITLVASERIPHPAGVYHHFTPDLSQHRVVLGDSYFTAFRNATSRGELNKTCTLDDPNLRNLRILTPQNTP